MGNVIVVAGKGGTGKTTIAAALTRVLAERRTGPVLAVDADPNSNLADTLGLKTVGTIADVIEEVSKKPEIVPQDMGKDAFIEYKIHSDMTENKGFDLLVMGRPEGPGCYCYVNNVLRNIISKLISDYRFVVIDNEAGMEHFSRKTTRSCNELIVVSDETEVGLRSAKRIFSLIEGLGIPAKRKFLVVNKVTAEQNLEKLREDFDVEKIFIVPYDEILLQLSLRGASLKDLSEESQMRIAIDAIGRQIWPKN